MQYPHLHTHTAQELRESRGGRVGLPVPNKPDGFCGCKATLKAEAVGHPGPNTATSTFTQSWLLEMAHIVAFLNAKSILVVTVQR